MVKINVASPLKRDEIRTMLESQTSPKYTYLYMNNTIEMTFEVEAEEGVDVLRTTKKLIHNMEYGSVLAFRVLYDGQIWDGGPIFKPGDPQYDSTHTYHK